MTSKISGYRICKDKNGKHIVAGKCPECGGNLYTADNDRTGNIRDICIDCEYATPIRAPIWKAKA